jgi:predicted CXXCH cytochrome family protein
MTCLTCHEAHGSSDDALLTLPISNNALCLSCHEALTPSLFAGQHRSGHGQLPILTSVQKTVATSFKTRIGAGDQLLCVTCHQTHHARDLISWPSTEPAASASAATQRSKRCAPHRTI